MEGLNPEPTVEVLYPARAELGEAPFYDEETKTLLWLDVDRNAINFLDPIARTNRMVKAPQRLTVIIPVQDSDTKLVALIGKNIALLDRNTGVVTDVLASVEEDKPKNSFNFFNDGKCDSAGRLWFGTRGNTNSPNNVDMGGGFYSFSNGVVSKHSDASLSNGLAWNVAEDALYHIDTFVRKLFKWRYKKEDGCVSNREVFIDFAPYADKDQVFADGMCTDEKGRLWVVLYNAGCVTCWDPVTGEKLHTVKIPGAKYTTSCCFGGPNNEWMFVTSGTFSSSKEELEEYPNSGHVFVIKDLGTRGAPVYKFRPKL